MLEFFGKKDKKFVFFILAGARPSNRLRPAPHHWSQQPLRMLDKLTLTWLAHDKQQDVVDNRSRFFYIIFSIRQIPDKIWSGLPGFFSKFSQMCHSVTNDVGITTKIRISGLQVINPTNLLQVLEHNSLNLFDRLLRDFINVLCTDRYKICRMYIWPAALRLIEISVTESQKWPDTKCSAIFFTNTQHFIFGKKYGLTLF